MGKTSKKLKALQKKQGEAAEAAMQGIPQSMVFRRGKVGPYVSDLVSDMRRVMLPYTAKSLKESKKNNLKDFSSVAAPLGVTHFMIFSQTVTGTNLRLTRLPHGPTFTFRLSNYSNIKDIVHMQKTPHSPGTEYQNPPLVVLNNFSAAALAQAEELAQQEDAEERTAFEAARAANPTSTLNPPSVEILKLTSTMWQNAFPPIDVANLQVKNCRRVVILQYEPRTCQVLFRHYLITAAPVGINKAIKKLIKNKVPDLSKLDDISEYIKSEHMAQLSDSEAEDAPDARITLPQSFVGRGNRSNSKSAIRLKEIGPRFTMQLLKVEEEMDGGKVMYHYRRSLTEKEALELAHKSKLKRDEKARRRAEQERNVERKNKRKRGEDEENDDDDQAEALETDPSIMVNAPHDEYSDEEDEDGDANMGTKSTKKKKSSGNSDADDDAEWYRKEVGEEPQEGLFDRSSESKSDRSFPLKAERRAEEIARKREASESKARKGLSKGNGNSDADDDEEDEKNGMQPQKKKQRMGGSHKKFGVSAEKQSGGGQGGHNVRHSDFKAAEAKLAKKESAKGKPATAPKKKGGKQ